MTPPFMGSPPLVHRCTSGRKEPRAALNRALFSTAAPDLGRAPAHAGRHGNRSVVRDFAAPARILRSSRAGHQNGRKKCSVVITLAASVTASGSGVFRLLKRSR